VIRSNCCAISETGLDISILGGRTLGSGELTVRPSCDDSSFTDSSDFLLFDLVRARQKTRGKMETIDC
jgi:hypothetical protein